jgi:hypothetical protein
VADIKKIWQLGEKNILQVQILEKEVSGFMMD